MIHELTRSSRATRIFQGDIAQLIESVGIDCFETELFRLVHRAIDCSHLNTVFFGTDDGRRLVLAANEGSSQIARQVGTRYIRQYWQLDPVHERLRTLAAGIHLVEIDSHEIDDAAYRVDCYTAVRIAQRISLCETRREGSMRANFYSSQGFSPGQKAAIADAAGLLMPLLWRHGKGRDRVMRTYEDFDLRLSEVAPELTPRERQVCALIGLGVSSEGIALRLEISINTVLTYRKRAYRRLGITSQNELLRLVGGPV